MLRKDHTRISLSNVIITFLCILVQDISLVCDVKDLVALYDLLVNIDNDVTIHMTTIVAATIDITTKETAVDIISTCLSSTRRLRFNFLRR